MRALILAVALLCGASAWADPVQDRINQIAAEITALIGQHATGNISEEDLFARMDALTTLDMQLRTGAVTLEDLPSVRWRDHEETPFYTAGFDLAIAGLPEGFSADVWAELPGGQRLEVETFRSASQGATELTVTLPAHPDGLQTGGTLTFHFGGPDPLGTLTAELAPVVAINNALPRLMRRVTGLVVQDLQAQGISPEALLAQLRSRPSSVDPAYGASAMLLWMWSEAHKGNEAYRFILDGRFDTPFWREFGIPDISEEINLAASAGLQNMLTLGLMQHSAPEVLDRIKAPALLRGPRLIYANTKGVTKTTLPDLAELVQYGRDLRYRREVVLGSVKSTHKLIDATVIWTPDAALLSSIVGGSLTITDQAMRQVERHYPNKIEIRLDPSPRGVVRADDSRRLDLSPVLVARSADIKAMAFADGVDLALLAADVGLLNNPIGKVKSALNLGELSAEQAAALSKQMVVAKEIWEEAERRSEARKPGKYQMFTIPGRTWEAPITEDTWQDYVSMSFGGEVAAPGRGFYGKACWDGSGIGANAVVQANSAAFDGLFARETAEWAVKAPNLLISPATGVLAPGESTPVALVRSGAEARAVKLFQPSLGAVTQISDALAVYSAPDDIPSCSEVVTLEAEYPTGADAANICTAPPRFSGTIFIKKGDARILTPSQLTCRDGEVLGFTVRPPSGSEVQCTLNGPGTLTMVGNEGLLDCPVRPRGSSSITCFTGQAPGQCAPVIPIKRIFPDFAVTAIVSADRDVPLNDNVEDFFDDCGIENPTALARELMDLGTGAADVLPVDPVSNPCPRPSFGGGAIVAGGGGESPNKVEPTAEGGYVANWPLGEGRDVSVADSYSYRHSPPDSGRGPGDRSVLIRSDISAEVTFDGPEQFTVLTTGSSVATSIRSAEHTPDPSGGYAQWQVWRRIVVTRDTEVTVDISTSGQGLTGVQAVPVRLVDNVPVATLAGFDQNRSSVMMVGNTSAGGLITAQSDSSTAILPGPRRAGERLTYLVLFSGSTGPGPDGEDRVSFASRTRVALDIRPYRK